MACILPRQPQYLTRSGRRNETCSTQICTRLHFQPSIHAHQQSLLQIEQQLQDAHATLRCNATGGLAPVSTSGVPSNSEEFQQLQFPGTLRQAWRLLLEVLWAKGHFADEYGDKEDAFEDITEVKRAVLDAARQRADIIFMLPKELLIKLAQVPLPDTPRSDERKLRNAYKRLMETYRPGSSTAAAQHSTASVQDVLRVIWSWEDAISSPGQSELKHATELEPVAVQLLHSILRGLFSPPDAAHQAAAEKLGTITASQVKQLQQYQAARQTGPLSHPAGKPARRMEARSERQGRGFEGRKDGPGRQTGREGKWQSYGSYEHQQQQRRADRRQSDGQQKWFNDIGDSLQQVDEPARQADKQLTAAADRVAPADRQQSLQGFQGDKAEHKGDDSNTGFDTNQFRFQVERYGQDGQRNGKQANLYGKSSALGSNRPAGREEQRRHSQPGRRTRQRPWQDREGSADTTNTKSAASQYARRSWEGGQQSRRPRQATSTQQSLPLKQQDSMENDGQKEEKGIPSNAKGTNDVTDKPSWKDAWQE